MSYFPKDSDFGHAHFDGLKVHLILENVKTDVLPFDDIMVPEYELPPPDQEGEGTMESIREREEKWIDIKPDLKSLR